MLTRNRIPALLLAALLVLAGGATAAAGPDVRAQVVGGTTAEPGWTSMAALIAPGKGPISQRQVCGGTLVAPTWVLTAGHCAQFLQLNPGGLIVIGRQNLDGTGGDERGIRSIRRHPGYTGVAGTGNDVALLELDAASTQATIPLMTVAAEPTWDGNTVGTIAGWGSTVASHGGYSSVLRSGTIPIHSDATCEQILGAVYKARLQLCGGTSAVTACDGDSGGPLVAQDTSGRTVLTGVVSFGPTVCGRIPGFFIRVSGYADWLAESLTPSPPVTTPPPTTPPSTTPTTAKPAAAGYSILAADGTVHSFGSATNRGSAGACKGPRSCVDIAGPTGGGYWVSRGSCDLSAFGPVAVLPSPNTNERCTLASTPSGKGLWALTPSGRVFNLGTAPAYGNGPPRPNLAWQQIEARSQGDGYWLLGSDGAVAAYGLARVQASSGGQRLGPVVGMASTPNGIGYWLVARDGAVASYGGARFYGSTAGRKLGGPVMGIQGTPSGAGYWLFGADGSVYAFGDAKVVGSATGRPGPMVGAVRR